MRALISVLAASYAFCFGSLISHAQVDNEALLSSFECKTSDSEYWPVTMRYDQANATVFVRVGTPNDGLTHRLPRPRTLPVKFIEQSYVDDYFGYYGASVYASATEFPASRIFIDVHRVRNGKPDYMKTYMHLSINRYQDWVQNIRFSHCEIIGEL